MSIRSYLSAWLGIVSLLALAGCGGNATAAPNSSSTAQPAASKPVIMPTPGMPASTGYPALPPTPVLPAATAYPGQVPLPNAAAPTPASPAVTGYPGQPANPAAGAAEAMVGRAKADLAKTLTISEAQINLVSAQPQDWPDASLGCPKAGQVYAQVITPGYRIVLEYAQKQYEYHTDLDTRYTLCAPTP